MSNLCEKEVNHAAALLLAQHLHLIRHNFAGALKVYQRSQKWLTFWPETCRGVVVGQLQRDLNRAVLEMQRLGPDYMAEFDLSLLKPIIYDRP